VQEKEPLAGPEWKLDFTSYLEEVYLDTFVKQGTMVFSWSFGLEGWKVRSMVDSMKGDILFNLRGVAMFVKGKLVYNSNIVYQL